MHRMQGSNPNRPSAIKAAVKDANDIKAISEKGRDGVLNIALILFIAYASLFL